MTTLTLAQTIRHAAPPKETATARSRHPSQGDLQTTLTTARAALWKQYLKLHDLVVKTIAQDELCRRFMRIPGVGPITALTFRTAVDDPARFKRSRDVGAYFGLTSKRWQSGSSIDVQGRISKAGNPMSAARSTRGYRIECSVKHASLERNRS